MTREEFRAARERMNLTRQSLAHFFKTHGDKRPYDTVYRQVAAWDAGEISIPSSLTVLFGFLEVLQARDESVFNDTVFAFSVKAKEQAA